MNFEAKKIESNLAVYKQIALQELAVGESICFFLFDMESRMSEQYGEFSVCVGLLVDENKPDMEQLLQHAEIASFIPNTQLTNMLEDEVLSSGNLYRITKSWDRGQKFKDGKVAKGYGYNVDLLKLGLQDISNFNTRFTKLRAESAQNADEVEEKAAPKKTSGKAEL